MHALSFLLMHNKCAQREGIKLPLLLWDLKLAYVDVYKTLHCRSVDTHCSNQTESHRLRGRVFLTVLGTVC